MLIWTRFRLGLATLALLAAASSASAQTVHRINMEADPASDEFRFVPSEVQASPGDVLVFTAASGAPHSVVFEGKGLSSAARQALNTGMPSRAGDLSSPLLTRNAMEYRVTLPASLPPGTYDFYCLPHRAYDMRGRLRVTR